MRKLLKLGANPDVYYECRDWSPLENAVHMNMDKIKLLLGYKAKKCWHLLLERYRGFIDTFIEYSTKDELNDGLIACMQTPLYLSEIMQKLIDNGANPSVALSLIYQKIIKSMYDVTCDNSKIYNHEVTLGINLQKFNFLCAQKAYDETTFAKVQNLQAIFSSLANVLEQNKTILNYNV